MRYLHPVLLLFVATVVVPQDWTAPENPDPSQILNEAQRDAASGRYKVALAKHVWFHQNALKHDPALYGVWLSFALGYWTDLGKNYKPALKKLRSIRDQAAESVGQDKQSPESFHDFASINEALARQLNGSSERSQEFDFYPYPAS